MSKLANKQYSIVHNKFAYKLQQCEISVCLWQVEKIIWKVETLDVI